MNNYKLKIENISCSNCAKTITTSLMKAYPNSEVRVNVASKLLFILTDASKEQVLQILEEINYPAAENDDGKFQRRLQRKFRVGIAISIYFLIMMFLHINETHFAMTQTNYIIQLVLASIVQFYVAQDFYKHAYSSIKSRSLGMDFLIVFSTTITYLFSIYLMLIDKTPYFETSTLIITIILIGKFMEEKTKNQTSTLIDSLNELLNDEVRMLDGSSKAVQQVEVGTSYQVLANERILVDGVITKGSTFIDEAPLTGESKSVRKKVGDEVFAGTMNIDSNIVIETTKYFEDNYLYKIINSVESASMAEIKYQRIADRIAGYFVPAVIFIAAVTFILTYLFTSDAFIAFEHAMSVVVISCPCSLGLATPTSILVSNSISAQNGILYKGAKFFELVNKVDIMAFDKTGTLTTGNTEVEYVDLDEQWFKYLYAIESKSTHPISKAAAKYFFKYDQKYQADVKQIPGIGLEGNVDGLNIKIANKKILIDEVAIEQIKSVENQGYTVNVILVDDVYVGYYALIDFIREDARDLIMNLKQIGIEPALITGDNQSVAKKVAGELGIDKYFANCLPDEKATIIEQLQVGNKIVGFVGDGINDSVSLKVADIGISVASGSDITKSASDVLLLNDDLSLIVKAISISKLTKKNIKRSFIWAFSYNIIAVPLAAFGFLNMILAAIFMGFSSIVVVLNALHLKREYKKWNKEYSEGKNE